MNSIIANTTMGSETTNNERGEIMLTVQQLFSDEEITAWSDVAEVKNLEQAERYIREAMRKDHIPASEFRVIKKIAHLEVDIKLVKEEEPRNINWNKATDDELLMLYLEKSVEKGRFLKTKDFDEDDSLPPYTTYYSRFGGITNIQDKVGTMIDQDHPQVHGLIQRFCSKCDKDPKECEMTPRKCLAQG